MNHERLQKECDLYRRLLELGHREQLGSLLGELLALAVEATDAEQGYLELYDDMVGDDNGATPTWWCASGCTDDDVDGIRAAISRGILAHALATGTVMRTPSALEDERFAGQTSVRTLEIRAVLCVPLGHDGIHGAIGALYLQRRRGIAPFDDDDERLARALARHVTPFVHRLLWIRRERDESDPTVPWRKDMALAGILGRSHVLARVFRDLAVVAPRDVTVLITGSSGTGKTSLARAIHANSPRCGKPFQELSCAAIPDELAENELFGALPGSHSTAHSRKSGKIEGAEGGTLFLDEVDELSPRLQPKLLQFLQSRTYYPLGASRPVTANVRLIAATNNDLEALVAKGRFRSDLFYRLAVMPIRMPSLADRREDIPLLAEHFCRVNQTGHDGDIQGSLAISPAGLRALQLADWPGNVRELANVVHRGLLRALGDRAPHIDAHHLLPDKEPDGGDPCPGFHAAVDAYKRQLLERALAECDWNVSAAARQLGLARSSMNALIRQLELDRPS